MRFKSSSYLIKDGIKNIWLNRMMSLSSIGVLISCLIITGAAVLISLNVSSLIHSIGDDNMLTVYLKSELSDIDSIKMSTEIEKIDNIKTCEFYSKEEVLKKNADTLGSIYSYMQGKDNPYPNAYKVQLDDLSKYDETIKKISSIDGVDSISNRRDIALKLTKLNDIVTYVGLFAVIILGIVTLFIISNTIRMTMYSRRFEISIMKSVGATNSFVRIPFLVEGMTLGLISGVISAGVIIGFYNPLLQTATSIAQVVGEAAIPLSAIWPYIVLAFVGAGILIGALGSLISVSKYLKKEGGEILGW